MMTMAQLRKKYRPVTPIEALEDLAKVLRHPKKENFSPPLITVVMNSGHTFRGYLINDSGPESVEKSFLFSIEMVNQGDGANDLIYIQGHRIESVTIWNVDDYSGILPRVAEKPTV